MKFNKNYSLLAIFFLFSCVSHAVSAAQEKNAILTKVAASCAVGAAALLSYKNKNNQAKEMVIENKKGENFTFHGDGTVSVIGPFGEDLGKHKTNNNNPLPYQHVELVKEGAHSGVFVGLGLKGGTMQICVSVGGGRTISLRVEPNDTIQEVKRKIRDLEGWENFELVYLARPLNDDRKTLLDYGIGEHNTLYAIFRVCGGFEPFTFSSFESSREIAFATTEVPAWRYLCRGLNLEGRCEKRECDAYNRKVWIKKGFGTFELPRELYTSKCPQCQNKVTGIEECGFFKCRFRISGEKKNREGINIERSHSNDQGFLKFLAGGEDSAEYLYLTMEVFEL